MGAAGRIVDMLRGHADRYLSGEEISQRLGVSRTAVWKHIHQLEAAGYRIAAVPHLGYRLLDTPDLLIPDEIQAGLRTRRFGRPCASYRETGSTNDRALEWAVRGAPEGALVAAEHQTQGRGRNGRTWTSRARANLLVSLVLRPGWPLERAPLLTLLAAAGVARGVEAVASLDTTIQWPNDIFVGEAKVAGILTEIQAQGDKIVHAVLGIGVNVNAAPAGAQRLRAASLAGLRGGPVVRLSVLRAVLEALEALYDRAQREGAGAILAAWRERDALRGQLVRVECARGGPLEGTAMGVDENGALLLRLDGGQVHRLHGGDVDRLRPAGTAGGVT